MKSNVLPVLFYLLTLLNSLMSHGIKTPKKQLRFISFDAKDGKIDVSNLIIFL